MVSVIDTEQREEVGEKKEVEARSEVGKGMRIRKNTKEGKSWNRTRNRIRIQKKKKELEWDSVSLFAAVSSFPSFIQCTVDST